MTLSLEQAVGLADKALYSAKKAGRNAWVGCWPRPPSVHGVLETLQADTVIPGDGFFEVRRSIDRELTEMAV